MYNPPLGAFLACVDGVRSQTMPDWEWCVVDDCSTRPEVTAALDHLAGVDERIRVRRREANGGIVAASNDALAMATGDHVVLLDHDDKVLPTALADVCTLLDGPDGDEIDYLYTDEAHVLTDGRETAHFLKPDWSPERFRASMYTCHLSVLRRTVVDEIGGFRTGFDGSQDHDLILRATEAITAAGRRIAHLPLVTYHWRNVSSSVSRARDTLDTAIGRGRRAVQEQCDRLAIDAEVVHGEVDGCYRVRRRIPPTARATVVVATAGELSSGRPYRLAAMDTLQHLRATRRNTRLVVAHPADLSAPLVELLDEAAGDRWQRLPVVGPWGLAVALDRVVQTYPADVLVSVAPGLVPRPDRTPDWLETLMGLALQPRCRSRRRPGGNACRRGRPRRLGHPELPLVRVGGDARRHHQLRQRPVHRARVQPGDARRRGHLRPPLARAEAHGCGSDRLGLGRARPVGRARRQRPGHAVDAVRALRRHRPDRLTTPPHPQRRAAPRPGTGARRGVASPTWGR